MKLLKTTWKILKFMLILIFVIFHTIIGHIVDGYKGRKRG